MPNVKDPGSLRRSVRRSSGFMMLNPFVFTPIRSVETLFEMYQPAKSNVVAVDGFRNSIAGWPVVGFQ